MVCRGFIGLKEKAKDELLPAMSLTDKMLLQLDNRHGKFLACGDLSGWDTDSHYPLDVSLLYWTKLVCDSDQFEIGRSHRARALTSAHQSAV